MKAAIRTQSHLVQGWEYRVMNLITKDVIGIFSTRGLANQYLLNTFTKKKRNVGYKSEPKFIYDSKQPYIIRKSYIGEVIEVEI